MGVGKEGGGGGGGASFATADLPGLAILSLMAAESIPAAKVISECTDEDLFCLAVHRVECGRTC